MRLTMQHRQVRLGWRQLQADVTIRRQANRLLAEFDAEFVSLEC